MKKIPLTQNKFALVDDADYYWLSRWKWCASKSGTKWYANHNFYSNGKSNIVRMHNVIMCGKGIDHWNGNGLDNQRENLRYATQAENTRNRRKPDVNNFPYKGIRPIGKTWRAIIGHKGIVRHLGMFTTPEEAAKAYDKAAVELFGEFARTNFA